MKYDHDIIRDLMPLVSDGIASPKSEAAVKEHITECEECAAEWKQMQKGIGTDKKEDEEARRYAETAKRVRKHDRRVAACVLAMILCMAFIGAVIASYHDGARFTLRGAMEYGVQDMRGLETALFGEADTEEKPEITYLGEVMGKGQHFGAIFPYNLKKNMHAISYAIVKLPKKNQSYFCGYLTERNDPDRLFMWNSAGLSAQPIESGINMVYNDDHPLSAAFYSTDERVVSIQFTFIHTKWSVELDDNHFGVIELLTGHGMQITEGIATDKDGNILYKTDDAAAFSEGDTRPVPKWVKAV